MTGHSGDIAVWTFCSASFAGNAQFVKIQDIQNRQTQQKGYGYQHENKAEYDEMDGGMSDHGDAYRLYRSGRADSSCAG